MIEVYPDSTRGKSRWAPLLNGIAVGKFEDFYFHDEKDIGRMRSAIQHQQVKTGIGGMLFKSKSTAPGLLRVWRTR